MDSLFDALSVNDRTMGSFALMKNGQPVYARAIGAGQINGAKRVPVTTTTEYRVGSVSKMFTATLVFQLIEEKKLSLNTPLATYFPQVPNAQQITIGHLLHHRSGIHNFTDDSTYATWYDKPQTKEAMVKVIAGNKPDFPPDSTGAYSNANYVLLGYIVEAVYKKPYSVLLKEKITAKAGLSHTRFIDKGTGSGEIFSFRYATDKWEKESVTDMSVPGGAGAVLSSPSDLTRFITLLFNGKIVGKESLAQMKTIKDGYGYGLFTFPFNNKKFYGHTGSIDGFASVVGYNPEDSLAFAYSINGTRYPTNDIAIGVLSIYYNKPFTIPSFNTYAVKPEELDRYVGTYTSKDMPLSVAITREGNILKAQATGQAAFPLEASAKDQFRFDPAGVLIDFDPAKGSLILSQRGRQYYFSKTQEK